MNWTLGTATGDVAVDGLSGDAPDDKPGSEFSVLLLFDGADALQRHSDAGVYGDSAMEGVTVLTGTASTGRPYYREELAGQPASSLLVSLVPDAGDGLWAVVTGARNASPRVGGALVWEFDILVLEAFDNESRFTIEDEYSDEVL